MKSYVFLGHSHPQGAALGPKRQEGRLLGLPACLSESWIPLTVLVA